MNHLDGIFATLDKIQGSRSFAGCSINYNWLKLQLRQDRRNHRSRLNRTIPGMRVLDCFQNRVISAKPKTDYVALSYVWSYGVPNQSSLSLGETLDLSCVPQTIRDAMELTKRLGKRYLWVDRYCIEQHDCEHKKSQIGLMGRIYAHSWVTLAAVAQDDTIAIPGLSSPRPRTACIQTSGGVVTTDLEQIWKEVQSSVWNTRAWTILSRRLIYLLPSTTVVVIDGHAKAEPPTLISERYHAEFHQRTKYPRGHGMQNKNLDPWFSGLLEPYQQFGLNFNQYCTRDLTYETDALEALRGFLSQLPWQSYWGIPLLSSHTSTRHEAQDVVLDTTGAFCTGLMWMTSRGQKRLQQFPSWSWTSSRGNSVYEPKLLSALESSAVVRLVRDLAVVTSAGSARQPCHDFFNYHREDKIVPAQSQFLEMSAHLMRYSTGLQRVSQEDASDLLKAIQLPLAPIGAYCSIELHSHVLHRDASRLSDTNTGSPMERAIPLIAYCDIDPSGAWSQEGIRRWHVYSLAIERIHNIWYRVGLLHSEVKHLSHYSYDEVILEASHVKAIFQDLPAETILLG